TGRSSCRPDRRWLRRRPGRRRVPHPSSFAFLLLVVPAELEAHRREELVLVIGLAARGEARVERGREDRRRNRLLDGALDGPAALARVGDAAGEVLQGRIGRERGRREIEEPGGDDAAAPPDLGDVAEVEVILVVLVVAERRGLRVDGALGLAGVGRAQDAE